MSAAPSAARRSPLPPHAKPRGCGGVDDRDLDAGSTHSTGAGAPPSRRRARAPAPAGRRKAGQRGDTLPPVHRLAAQHERRKPAKRARDDLPLVPTEVASVPAVQEVLDSRVGREAVGVLASSRPGRQRPRRGRAPRRRRPPRSITTKPAIHASVAMSTPGTSRSTSYFGGGMSSWTSALIVAAGSRRLCDQLSRDAGRCGSGRGSGRRARAARGASAAGPSPRRRCAG